MSIRALFGGTFDPVHFGHLRPLEVAAQQLALPAITLVPCFVSPHKSQPAVSASHRYRMLELATEHSPLFDLSDYEIKQPSPSYTVDTLRFFKQQHPGQSLLFIMGADSFENFTQWYRWKDILELANLLVLARPGFEQPSNPELQSFLTESTHNLAHYDHGHIATIDSPLLAISSTQIRQNIKEQKDLSELIPESVLNYIKKNHLYS